MSNENLDLGRILSETRETLLNPNDYFSSMPLSGGFAEPVIKAAIYGTIAGLFALLWSVTGLSAMGGGMMMGSAVGIMALIWTIIGAIIGLFIGGALMLLVSVICGGNQDYEANVRVTASIMAIYPINAFLSFLYGINLTLGSLVGLLVSLYSIYLIYLAATLALKGRDSSARIVAIVLVVLSLLGTWGGRKATRTMEDMSDMFQEELVD